MNNKVNNLVNILNKDAETSFKIYGIIYKITNLINNKIYIGQTRNSLKERWSKHVSKNNKVKYLSYAIQKYGKTNFSIEEIDSAENIDKLNQLEIYWIKYYNSHNSNFGYNLTQGGEQGMSDEERIKKNDYFIKCVETEEVFITIKDAANHKDSSSGCIHSCINRKNKVLSCKGYTWVKINKKDVDITKLMSCKIKIPNPEKRNKVILPEKYKDVYKARAKKNRKKILCLETNEVWESITMAREAINGDANLNRSIQKNKKYRGKTYILVK